MAGAETTGGRCGREQAGEDGGKKNPLSLRGEREEFNISAFGAARMTVASPRGAAFGRERYPRRASLVACAAIRWVLLSDGAPAPCPGSRGQVPSPAANSRLPGGLQVGNLEVRESYGNTQA